VEILTVARDLVARAADWLLLIRLDGDGERLDVRQVLPCEPPPAELLAELREHKAELVECLRFEERADALWRAVFWRLRGRTDLPADPMYRTRVQAAEDAHRRHDFAALVAALAALEAYADTKQVQP
jgi:hypothetical protein